MKSFSNHFIISMPHMNDPIFSKSLIYICEHDDDGAMGLRRPQLLSLGWRVGQIESTLISRVRRGRFSVSHATNMGTSCDAQEPCMDPLHLNSIVIPCMDMLHRNSIMIQDAKYPCMDLLHHKSNNASPFQ